MKKADEVNSKQKTQGIKKIISKSNSRNKIAIK